MEQYNPLSDLDTALKKYYSQNRGNGSYNCLLPPLKRADRVLANKGILVLDFRNPSTICEDSDEPLERLKKLSIEARNRICEDNLGLVGKIARKYPKLFPELEYGDVKAEGIIGLFEAIRDYDLSRGVPFPHYAMATIDRYIMRQLHKYIRIADIPINFPFYYNAFEYFEGEFKEKFNRSPKDEELANFMGRTIEHVRKMRLYGKGSYKLLSLHHPIFQGEDAEIIDAICDEDSSFEYKVVEELRLEEKLSILSPRERSIVLERLKGKTLEDVAKEKNLTKQRISQIELRAARKLDEEKEREEKEQEFN